MNAYEQVVVESLPRARRRALLLAAATLWLPTLVPPVLGMLRDCDHCLQTYLLCLPAIPGIILPVLLNLDDFWFFAVAAVPIACAFAVLYAAGREMPRGWLYALQGVVITLIAFESIGFAYALRA